MNKYLKLTAILLAVSFLTVSTLAQNVEESLDHSYRSLGNNFSSENYMTPSQGAQLSLIDLELAKELGFDTHDIGQLEKEIVKRYALETTKEKTNIKRMSTTYAHYQKHTGDGRAVWHEEIKIKLKSGKTVYLDVTTKGVGKTNSAGDVWTSRLHGYQTLREAVHSYLLSKKNVAEGLDSTRDLAVIKLPVTADFGMHGIESLHPVAITVRVGRQIRPAHYGSAAQTANGTKKLLKYEMIRNLGYPLNHKLTSDDAKLYLDNYINNFAQETARMKDLFFFHGMLHASNASSTGGSIDFGTSRQLDGYYGDILDKKGQGTGKFENIFYTSLYYMGFLPRNGMTNEWGDFKQGHMPEVIYKAILNTTSASQIHESIYYDLKEDAILGPALEEYDLTKFAKKFKAAVTKTFTELALNRIGLSPGQIAEVVRHPEMAEGFYHTVEKMYFSTNGSLPKYDTHRILSKAVEIVSSVDYKKDGFGRYAQGDRAWELPLQNTDVDLIEFLDYVKEMMNRVAPAKVQEIIKRANNILPESRVDYSQVTTEDAILSTDLEKKLYELVKEGKSSFVENNKIANEFLNKYSQKHILERTSDFTHSFASKTFRDKVEADIHPKEFKLVDKTIEKPARVIEVNPVRPAQPHKIRILRCDMLF